jgi:hypothetical protein
VNGFDDEGRCDRDGDLVAATRRAVRRIAASPSPSVREIASHAFQRKTFAK